MQSRMCILIYITNIYPGEMKKVNSILTLVAIFLIGTVHGQEIKDWRNLKPEQRKELISKMKPEEKQELLQQFRENMMMEELDIPADKKNEFRALYSEYQESQKQIKERFKASRNFEGLNDRDAKQELDKSFELGEQLMNNRRKYSEKFQKILKPQQILEMFQNEGMMRNKILERKNDNQNRAAPRGGSARPQERGRTLHPTPGNAAPRNSNNNGFRTQSRRP